MYLAPHANFAEKYSIFAHVDVPFILIHIKFLTDSYFLISLLMIRIFTQSKKRQVGQFETCGSRLLIFMSLRELFLICLNEIFFLIFIRGRGSWGDHEDGFRAEIPHSPGVYPSYTFEWRKN